MSIFICKSCGKPCEVPDGETKTACDACGGELQLFSMQDVPVKTARVQQESSHDVPQETPNNAPKRKGPHDPKGNRTARIIIAVIAVVVCAIPFSVLCTFAFQPSLVVDTMESALHQTVYDEGVARMEAGEYEEAIEIFQELDDFSDAKDKVMECYEALGQYNKVVDYYQYTEYTVPDGVTEIPAHAFEYCKTLEKVIIPDSVTHIGEYAFCGCSALTGITIPESVTSIGKRAFFGCSNLSTIYFNAVAVEDVTYEQKAFFGAGFGTVNGTTLIVGKNVTRIPAYLFSSYNNSYVSPNDHTARFCLTSVVFEEGSVCESIGDQAFRGDRFLSCVTLPEGIKSIGVGAFGECNLTEIILPNSVEYLGAGAFHKCENLSSVTLSNQISSINGTTFYGCIKLTHVTIPDGVTSLGKSAFADCIALTSVTIGAGVETIAPYAFSNCSAVKSISFADPENWYCILDDSSGDDTPDEIAMDLSDSVENIAYFTTYSGYLEYNWYKKPPKAE